MICNSNNCTHFLSPTTADFSSDNLDVADIVIDEEHLVDDLGGVYTEKELEKMDVDEKVIQLDLEHVARLFLYLMVSRH